jgi:flap endonuclease-1
VGIDLGDIVVRRPVTFQHFAGRRVAIDAWNILYQFLSSIRGPDGRPLTDREGRITSHLNGLLNRTAAMVEAGIRPVYVFDGEPHPLKRETLAARSERKQRAQAEYEAALPEAEAAQQAVAAAATEEERLAAMARLTASRAKVLTKAQQTSRLTVPMVEDAQALLRALGVPVVQAPGEGEAQAAWMAQQGLVDAAVSQDYDAILFGTPLLVRHLATGGRRKMPGKQLWVDVAPEEVPLAESLAALGLTREQLVDVALLVGTDFHPGIKGIGAKKAVAMVQAAGSLEALLQRLERPGAAASAAERQVVEQQEALADRLEVRRIFLEPLHADPGDLLLRPPDPQKVREIMVERHDFSAERVQAALAKFQAARGRMGQARLF